MTPEERQRLVLEAFARWRRGNHRESSFRTIVELLYQPLQSFFVRQGFASEQAHDLTQECFVGIYKGIEDFREESRFTTWAFTIAKNTALKHYRDQRAHKRGAGEVPLRLEEQLEEPRLKEPDPLDRAIERERQERLRRAVEALPNRMRTVLKMHLYQQRSRQDIADALAISPETVKAQLAQARRRLAQELGESTAASSPGNSTSSTSPSATEKIARSTSNA